jgi:hypothetical protein
MSARRPGCTARINEAQLAFGKGSPRELQMSEFQWCEVSGPGPKWARRDAIDSDGVIYVPAAVAGGEREIFLCASWDRTPVRLWTKANDKQTPIRMDRGRTYRRVGTRAPRIEDVDGQRVIRGIPIEARSREIASSGTTAIEGKAMMGPGGRGFLTSAGRDLCRSRFYLCGGQGDRGA